MLAVIHCEPAVPWQAPFARKFAQGCRRLGINTETTNQRSRLDEGVPVLLGTTFWKMIEHDGGPYLLVDRCQFGDTNQWVTLGWNGHGREADFKVPVNHGAARWELYGQQLKPWREWDVPNRIALCGQLPAPIEWYNNLHPYCSVFRPHPADQNNPTPLPACRSWADVDLAVTYCSTVANESVMAGIPTVSMHPRAMSWDVSSHHPTDPPWRGDRLPWCHWLAWTQWSHDEIADGVPHLWE